MSLTRDSMLADPQLIIADLRRQLAERERELKEARAQRAATAEVLQTINASPGIRRDAGEGVEPVWGGRWCVSRS